MNHDIRMVVCDLDGTIVRQDNTISDFTLSIIKRLIAQGIRFIPCTGRSYIDMRSAFPKDMPFPSILLNGAMFAKPNGKPITTCSMNDTQVKMMEQLLHAFSMPCLYFTVDGLYGNGNISQLSRCIEVYYPDAIGSEYFIEPIQWIKSIDDLPNKVLKIETMHEDIQKIKRLRSYISHIHSIQMASSLPYNIEITEKDTNKANMLDEVMKHYSLKEQNVMYFGDSANDLAVFTRFPNVIAVDNAISQVKQLASDHCASCACDGVAYYLLEKRIIQG